MLVGQTNTTEDPNMNKTVSVALIFTLCACSSNQQPEPKDGLDLSDNHGKAVHFLRPMFDVFDCEGVGAFETGEVDEHYFGVFKASDPDHSRTITQEEYIESIPDADPELEAHIFQQMDNDANGLVTYNEFLQHIYWAFETADKDNNGELTEEEADMSSWRKHKIHE